MSDRKEERLILIHGLKVARPWSFDLMQTGVCGWWEGPVHHMADRKEEVRQKRAKENTHTHTHRLTPRNLLLPARPTSYSFQNFPKQKGICYSRLCTAT